MINSWKRSWEFWSNAVFFCCHKSAYLQWEKNQIKVLNYFSPWTLFIFLTENMFFQVQLDFQVFFLSCRLAKIVNYHEHDNVSFSLIFAPFIMFVIFHGVPILKCMYVLQKQIVLSEIFRIKCSFSPWNDRIISFWHFQKMFSSSTWYSSIFSFCLQN